jgi:hypothetical protein
MSIKEIQMTTLHNFYIPHKDAYENVDIDKLGKKMQGICIDMGSIAPAHKILLSDLLTAMATGSTPAYATYARMPGTKPPP